jgi:hypothetical protein
MNWSNLASFRILIAALVIAGIPAALAAAIWPPLGTAVLLGIFGVIYYNVLFNPRFQAYCPHCRKRVKLGADTCHHCTRSVVR